MHFKEKRFLKMILVELLMPLDQREATCFRSDQIDTLILSWT